MQGNRATVLALDISSSGVSAAVLTPELEPIHISRFGWEGIPDLTGRETLSASFVWDQTCKAIQSCVSRTVPPEAITLSSMMHTLVLTDAEGLALSPVYTWMDSERPKFADEVEARLGRDYSLRTGAYFHPSFPVFKLARLAHETPRVFSKTERILSVKAYVGALMTGHWVEDVSTASASGLLNLGTGAWDALTLDILGIDVTQFPSLIQPTDAIGPLSESAAELLGLRAGLPVIAGGGDGFLATLGSGCETPARTAITVGTTASVRRFAPIQPTEDRRGAFCYRYAPDKFLVGATSNNGGNVLDWAREKLGVTSFTVSHPAQELPLFLPHLYGERAPFWDSKKHARWILPSCGASVEVLGRSVVEGLAFQLGVYCERVTEVLGQDSETNVLSGNGFQTPELAAILAAIIPAQVIEPASPGLATSRGAARCGFQALGIATAEATESLLAAARKIAPDPDRKLTQRYRRFKQAYFDTKHVSN
jgi:gluconokinase